MKRILGTCTLAATALFAMVQPRDAEAAWIGDVTQDSCTAINCNAQSISGTTIGFAGGAAETWSDQFGIAAGDCVRFDVVSEDTDLRLTIIAPNGNVYQNDDRAIGDNRPLVKIASAPNFGSYTVQLAHYNGNSVTANFNLLWNRYNAGNPNCASPTAPFAARSLQK